MSPEKGFSTGNADRRQGIKVSEMPGSSERFPGRSTLSVQLFLQLVKTQFSNHRKGLYNHTQRKEREILVKNAKRT